jgi:16S rRNA (uracil1498-N3)-methyltransferase
MRCSRIFTPLALAENSRLALDPRAAHYLTQVLRLRRGDSLTLFNGDGRDYAGSVLEAGRSGVHVALAGATPPESPPALRLHLALGVARGERMDFALQKAVELGVCSATPLFTGRSLVSLEGARLQKRMTHWRGVMISACEQSGRRLVPPLQPAQGLAAWLDRGQRDGVTLHHEAPDGLDSLARPSGDFFLLTGPEGGLDPAERALAAACGLRPVRLGPRILRTETAPLAALAAMQMQWGDFRQDCAG